MNTLLSMPYVPFETTRDGRKVFCTRNISNGEVICYQSRAKRKTGIRMREIAHGMRLKGKKFKKYERYS